MTALDRGQAFAAGALAGAALTAVGAYYYCSRSQTAASGAKQPQQHTPDPAGTPQHANLQEFDQDEVLAEQLTRNVQFFGLDKQKQVAKSFVVVIGLGVSTINSQDLISLIPISQCVLC